MRQRNHLPHVPTIAELQDPAAYDHLLSLTFSEIPAFVKEYYTARHSWITVCHYAAAFLTLAAFILIVVARDSDWSAAVISFGLGSLLFFALLPLHEAIHGLAYRFFGARDVRYGLRLREGYAYATAHEFVIGRRPFVWVIISPFLVINTILIGLALAVPAWAPVLIVGLLLHIGGTSGDWSLLNYLWQHRERELLTYDDATTQISYFYARRVEAEGTDTALPIVPLASHSGI